MSNQRLTKLRKQPDATWSLLQRRLIQLPDPFANLFPEEVWTFIQRKAESLSTNAGYVTTTLLTTTAYHHFNLWSTRNASQPIYSLRRSTDDWKISGHKRMRGKSYDCSNHGK